ncbi:type I DNA topoisomerase [Streptomyces triticagri]|uniref:DNA topoisomerase 1 n=1 Tax=Streptomyces triticagri TaxID=2293568 RepID=A0A372MBS0_9ACTN|nr:type I DNA topoisomerase [Streptomyces triticagri]RFU88356.1 type I DNA topoisomerase [Streptomyces triticagri]
MSPTSETAQGGRRLVIVESPAKAKTIKGYLGPGYVVEASVGHIRDLPNGAAEVPEKYTGEVRRLGVDVEHDFQPIYVVNADKKAQVKKLKDLLKDSDELLLATDEDREGEAIAWHLLEVLKPKVPVKRMVFHEITKAAIQGAVANPRELNKRMVDAQETRRILDRLYGYEVSPVLWKKVMPRLSAGRVQSVATRLVVERERERIAFRSAEYWDLTGTFGTGRTGDSSDPAKLVARLTTVDGKRIAQGRDFNSVGELKPGSANTLHLDEANARALAAALEDAQFAVRSVESKPYRRSPYAPFRTTTLQQEASRKLGFGAKATMQVAQKLYENGFITYMRTDSTTLSDTAVTAARTQVTQLYGSDYLPDKPRTYAGKVKNAQEAHEAIRPSGDRFRTPAETGLTGDQFRLYELIWKRTVASQMKDATGNSVTVKIGGTASDGRDAEFSASGKTITFHGFLKAYVEGADDPNAELDDRERRLPQVAEGDGLTAEEIAVDGHATKPPARYTEASLVKELEEREIGRPSTYASIIGTILDRGYVFKKGTALVPSFLSFAVVNLLEKHFGRLVDYDFTARMEDDLDRIARGEAQAVPWLRRFYFGEGDVSGAASDAGNGDGDHLGGLKELVTDLGAIDAREVSSFPISEDVVLRVGRYGPYVERGEKGAENHQRADVPDDLAPDELTVEYAEELLAKPSGDFALGTDPETGREILAKDGRYGPYVTEVLPEGTPKTGKNAVKPRTASLFKSMSLDTVTLEDALKLMSLPRVVGQDAEGVDITAQNGRYGPYLKKGTDSRSLETEEQLFSITVEEALEIYSKPKQRGRAAAKPPLKELGEDPVSGKPVVVKDGRFGPYVTDGETNATLRAADSVEEITAERGFELLAEKRAKGPAKKTAKKAAKKAPAKKTAAKKTAAKKTAAKKTTTAAKKTAAKKTTAKKTTAKKTTAKKAAPAKKTTAAAASSDD